MTALSQVRRGVASDMPTVLELLENTGLPISDLPTIGGLRIWVIESADSICGVIALEPFGREGLLRSLAVASDYRGRGIGHTLVGRLEADARAEGVHRLVLLTQTAETFFRDLGYQNMDRSQVSDEMCQCAEFRTLCPASAICMAKTLVTISNGEPAHDR